MSFTFRPAIRENVPLLLGVAGGTGSGKTYSALRLATGLAAGKRFAVVDTENGRARHYADAFDFDVTDLAAPFRPDRYGEAIAAADNAGYPVIVVDSASHEHAGDGGLLDWHQEEYERMGSRDAVKMAAWIKPKLGHKAFVSRLLQVRAHVILCFRAEEKVEMIDDPQNPRKKLIVPKRSLTGLDGWIPISEKSLPYELTASFLLTADAPGVPKRSLTGLDGWIPISEKSLPYELTASFLLTADAPGVPKPIKLQEQHRELVSLAAPLDEATGGVLGEWAAGGSQPAAAAPDEWAPESAVTELLELAARVSPEAHTKAESALIAHRAEHEKRVDAKWLARQASNLRAKLPAVPPEPEEPSMFQIPASVREGVAS